MVDGRVPNVLLYVAIVMIGRLISHSRRKRRLTAWVVNSRLDCPHGQEDAGILQK